MNSNQNTSIDDYIENDIDLIDLLKVIWKSKIIVMVFIFIFSISAVIYSLLLPNEYESSAILSPVVQEKSANTSMKNLGGLAGIAGIDLSSRSGSYNSFTAPEKIKSLSFFKSNILPNIFLPNLMAIESWDRETNTITYDKNKYYDGKWVRKSSYLNKKVPSAQESFSAFIDKHFEVTESKDTGFLIISVKHQSPFIAKKWTELIVDEINHFYRAKDRAEAKLIIEFLNTALTETSFSEVKEVIADLLKNKIQELSLIEVSNFYVYEYIDLPVAPEKKFSPNRALICILGAFFGFVFGVVIVLFRHYFNQIDSNIIFKENS
jgi:LPS O-antigen subunit length determinant protein (WzzB/FepE family)